MPFATMMRRALNPLMGKSEKMSKPEVSPEEINKGTLVAVAVAAVAGRVSTAPDFYSYK